MSHTCEETRAQLALLLYGELSFDEEEAVETHLEACGECRAALGRERELHAAFDGVEIEPPVSLLRECRDDLRGTLASIGTSADAAGTSARATLWWDRFVDAVSFRSHHRCG